MTKRKGNRWTKLHPPINREILHERLLYALRLLSLHGFMTDRERSAIDSRILKALEKETQ